MLAILIASELPFLLLATAAFVWGLGLVGTGPLVPAVTLVALTYLLKTAVLVPIYVRLLTPTERALAAGAEATGAMLVAGAQAARRLTLLGPVMVGIGWGATFLLPTLVLQAMAEGLPYGDRALLAALLFSGAITLGVPPASYGITLLTLRGTIRRLSLAARAAGAAEPSTRAISLRTQLILLSLALALGPALWVMSMAYGPVLLEHGMAGLLTATLLFGLVAVLWAIVTAVAVGSAIGGSIAHMTQLVEEIALTGGATATRVPALQNDELGRLAEAVNGMTDHLSHLDRTKRQFLATAAHELKTPVTLVKGYAQFLRSAAADPKRLDSALESIERGAHRIDRIVCDCLDFAQFQLGSVVLRPKRFDLGAEIQAWAEHEASSHDHAIRVRGPLPPAWVHADPTRIEHVFRNLLDNAVERSPDGEAVEVSLRAAPEAVTVSVVDRGEEIPEAWHTRIFEPFAEAAADSPIGHERVAVWLYTSHEMMRQSGGELGLSGSDGRGTAFWFRLPSASSAEGE